MDERTLVTLRYPCWACGHEFLLAVEHAEARGSLRGDRSEACPACAQRVGYGFVACHACSTRFEVRLPHLHVGCTLSVGPCPGCGRAAGSLCVC